MAPTDLPVERKVLMREEIKLKAWFNISRFADFVHHYAYRFALQSHRKFKQQESRVSQLRHPSSQPYLHRVPIQ